MSDVIIKSENQDENDSNSSLCALTTLLEEVKKEEQKSLSDEEPQAEDNGEGALPESFFDDLYRDEIEAATGEETTDADIQKLQEIIARKKRILNEDLDESSIQDNNRSQSSNNRKRKDGQKNKNRSSNHAKRPRKGISTSDQTNEPTNSQATTEHNEQQPPTVNWAPSTKEPPSTDPEEELEKLLKTEDYNSDDEPTGSSLNNMQPMYTFPNGMPMMPTMFNPATNQMMPNMLSGGYPMMFNMGYPQGFYPPNMNMQMMGCGLQQMNVPQSNDNEVQCLPVSEPGLPKIPFKKIKLEKTPVTVETPIPSEDPKKKIVDDCLQFLKKMKLTDSGGKFVYTPTITKQKSASASNSILLNITNVSYNFQAIGPKQNLLDWGLKGIPDGNAEIAKKISMSADRYFHKLIENSDTIARKLIKQEVNKADKDQKQHEMEIEEPTLSSYFRNSMTQTEPLACRECVARNRKVGHNIAVQTVKYSGSIGVQTDPEVRFEDHLTEGLHENQLKALYEFSKLIREPPKNSPAEVLRMRDSLMNMYNLSQRQHRGIVPVVDFPCPEMGVIRNLDRDPRQSNSLPSNSGRFANNDHGHQANNFPSVQMPVQQQVFPNFVQHHMQLPNQLSINRYSGPVRGNNEYVPNMHQIHPPPNMQPRPRNTEPRGYGSQHPDRSLPDYPESEGRRKNYGRGGLRR